MFDLHVEHVKISMTIDIYSHVIPTMQEEVMERLNEVFKDKIVENTEENKDDDGSAAVGT
jgi:hypothetical protein